MSRDKLLALYHFCAAWHSGQWSREYRIGCRVSKVFQPTRSEEELGILSEEGYELAREYYVSLIRSTRGEDRSGYIACQRCSSDTVVNDMRAEHGVTRCDDCLLYLYC